MRQAWYWRWRLRGKEPATCLGCGGALTAHQLPVAIARTRNFEVRAEGLPYRACASGCGDRRAAAPDFAHAVVDEVIGGALPVARSSRAGDWQCGRCSSRLWSPVRRLATISGQITLAGIPSFVLTITGPTATCGSCGAVQIRTSRAVARELADTLGETWRAAGLRSGFR